MSEITGTGISVAHEAYAFACMRCGYGWEQAYDIEHHVDAAGQEFVVYKAEGERVPSPLSSPTCMNCGGHVVRIMRAGQVSSVLDLIAATERHQHGAKATKPVSMAGPIGQELTEATEDAPEAPPVPHHWHLSDLLHPFRKHE
ncbi:hypothetical protein AQF52_3375 [Streptomyces venezuelae]|uniref:hypothetical protein n=1 Tax=Streptomyces gardneri TaxID=66892 RepID=UPI0006BDEB96|nr:hypothetical protein [Streptomyces gardneri]ALO08969.1 hypothetical protein AQF52_3375 [Streptomyces venezuelae]QPK46125.1 hypothetical protein H4W23_16795 [Streptomyces gardneri]WRK37491.1 hypothetical protein U0M97_16880 [Streptomyces venezuelae]CUM40641.1 FIG01124553: hypothetical protein [Streptomyces venezuelae]